MQLHSILDVKAWLKLNCSLLFVKKVQRQSFSYVLKMLNLLLYKQKYSSPNLDEKRPMFNKYYTF
jgi:hypothetical protein